MADEEETSGTGEPSEVAPPAAGRSLTGWQRLSQSFINPPGPRAARPQPAVEDLSHLSDAERQRRINQIDATERKVGLAAGALAFIFALAYTIPYMVRKIAVATTVKPVHKACTEHLKYTVNKGTATCNTVYPPSHYVFFLVVWLALAAAIFVTVRVGRRALVAFAIVITGLAFGTFILLLPFLVGGGWLLLRAWRTQRYGSPTARAPVEGYVRATAAARRAARSPAGSRNATRRRRANAADAADGAPAERRPPPASKRYTPKAPPRKRPPPEK